MNADERDAFDKSVLAYVTKHGTVRPNDIARHKKCKHETAVRSLQRLVDSGHLYSEKIGTSTYFTLRPDSLSEKALGRLRPDTPEFPLGEGMETDGCGRGSVSEPPSWSHKRARSVSERLPMEGFVLHPSVKGCDISRDWVRAHHNGQYKTPVLTVGRFNSFNPDTNESCQWKTSKLGGQTVYNVSIYPHKDGETKPYKGRLVTTSTGRIHKLNLYVHPRYVWHESYEHTEIMEFRQQVRDALGVLEGFGWRFDKDSIEMTGTLHTALNDPVLASNVGKYNELDGDDVHYDKSPGFPECEIYGNANPEDVEIMVKLPTIIRSFSTSIHGLHKAVTEIVEIQTLMAQSMAQTIHKSTVPQFKTDADENGMYR